MKLCGFQIAVFVASEEFANPIKYVDKSSEPSSELSGGLTLRIDQFRMRDRLGAVQNDGGRSTLPRGRCTSLH
jgi:hypothetical protein